MKDVIRPKFEGFIKIFDKTTGEILVSKSNAINFENMSIAIANSLADRDSGTIFDMAFGNGGATVSGNGTVTYLPPNVTGQNATLYGETFAKVVNDKSPLNINPETNFITINHTANTLFTDIVITCTLDFGEPSSQAAFDDTTDNNGNFVFDELGIRAFDPTVTGLLLTHVIFHPVQKSLNRAIVIEYTIRISMA